MSYIKILIDDICKEYYLGDTVEQIADKHLCTIDWVINILKKYYKLYYEDGRV